MYWVQSHHNDPMFKECKKSLFPVVFAVLVKNLSLVVFAVLSVLLSLLGGPLGTCLYLACVGTFWKVLVVLGLWQTKLPQKCWSTHILTNKVASVDETVGMSQQDQFTLSFDIIASMPMTWQHCLSLSFALLMFEESIEECMLRWVPLSGLEHWYSLWKTFSWLPWIRKFSFWKFLVLKFVVRLTFHKI